MQPAWRIPGVGILHPSVDRVTLVSPESVGALRALLPYARLKKEFHFFDIISYRGPDPRLKSTITAVGAGSVGPWVLLSKHAKTLGRYRITQAELAFDVKHCPGEYLERRLLSLIGRLDKPRHQRGYLHLIDKPSDRLSPGYLPRMPTIYYEDRRSSVAMKCYARKAKLPEGRFGVGVVRLEWTLKGKPALVRHLGGNKIGDLLATDLTAFLGRNLRLARVDHAAVGRLFRVKRSGKYSGAISSSSARSITYQFQDPMYRERRAAFLLLRVLAYREFHRPRSRFATWEQALFVCQESPAQVRGYLRELRQPRRRRGRPKKSPIRKLAFTDYRINSCFRPVQL
jgi:hypothetical protein